MMHADSAPVLRLTRQFSASAERVFDAWLDPERVGRWLFATENGTMIRVEVDARVGGRFVLVNRREGLDIEHVGEYLEIDRPRRLVFTFGVPTFSPLMTRVTIEIVPAGEGCELTLSHEGVPPEYMEPNTRGWTMILSNLALHLDAAN